MKKRKKRMKDAERMRLAALQLQRSFISLAIEMIPACRQMSKAIRSLGEIMLRVCAAILKKEHPSSEELEFLYDALAENVGMQNILLQDEKYGVTEETALFLRGDLYRGGRGALN